eukprot:1799889-Pleurochrysis_carterae.AAC.1
MTPTGFYAPDVALLLNRVPYSQDKLLVRDAAAVPKSMDAPPACRSLCVPVFAHNSAPSPFWRQTPRQSLFPPHFRALLQERCTITSQPLRPCGGEDDVNDDSDDGVGTNEVAGTSETCRSGTQAGGTTGKPLIMKDLRFVWREWPCWNATNTVL